jgi:2-oxo-hept-3-ene-1,7-dioate hydratase
VLEQAEVTAIAGELAAARRSGQRIPLLTRRYPQMSVDDAYAVQALWASQVEAGGRQAVGHKIGLTSRVMQAATGISEPDYGVIFDDMVLDSGWDLSWETYAHPRVEVELAFHLKSELKGPGVTVLDVLRATDFVLPALEILESRIEMDGRTIVDTISDNAACGAVVTGGLPVPPHAIDLRRTGAILYRNQTVEETGLAAAVLDNPAVGVAWLANKLSRHGAHLQAGELILAGSFTRPVWVERGDVFHADYGQLGTVTCSFS